MNKVSGYCVSVSGHFRSRDNIQVTVGKLLKLRGIVLLLLGFSGLQTLSGNEISQHRWEDGSSVIAFADVHGAYDALVSLLKKTNVVDESLSWVAGSAHLVSLGDLLDRGGESRKVLELLMRLEQEAEPFGGHVHVALGNHEIMNLTGDLRYVSAAEYQAFADEEDAAVRRSAFARYVTLNWIEVDVADPTASERHDLEDAFEKKFPLGFFAHRRAFGFHGHYGQWLLQQSQVLIINGTIFVHGGLSPDVAGLGLNEIHQRYDGELFELMETRQALLDLACIYPEQDLAEAVQEANASKCDPAQVKGFSDLAQGQLFSEHSPTWFRGGSLCHELLEEQNLIRVLEGLGSKRIVVGHSPTSDHLVQTRFGGRLVRLDTGMLRSHYKGQPSAIMIEGGSVKVVYLNNISSLETGQSRIGLRTAKDESILRNGIIENVDPDKGQSANTVVAVAGIRAEQEVQVKWEGETIVARFVALKSKDINREVAAYLTDKSLGLEIVPMTIPRKHMGDNGVLIMLPGGIVSEAERIERKLYRPNWCGVGNVFQLMYVFDGLIGNEGRSAATMAYDLSDWQLHVTNHRRAFSRSGKLPSYLQQVEHVLPEGLAVRLADLTDDKIRTTLGKLLSKSQINGLIRRRELLLTNWKIQVE